MILGQKVKNQGQILRLTFALFQHDYTMYSIIFLPTIMILHTHVHDRRRTPIDFVVKRSNLETELCIVCTLYLDYLLTYNDDTLHTCCP